MFSVEDMVFVINMYDYFGSDITETETDDAMQLWLDRCKADLKNDEYGAECIAIQENGSEYVTIQLRSTVYSTFDYVKHIILHGLRVARYIPIFVCNFIICCLESVYHYDSNQCFFYLYIQS